MLRPRVSFGPPSLASFAGSQGKRGGQPHDISDDGRGGVDLRARRVRAVRKRGHRGPADAGSAGGVRGPHHCRRRGKKLNGKGVPFFVCLFLP